MPIDASKFHPSVRTLFAYWLNIHPHDGLPGRQHFDPGAVAELLPNIRLVDVHRDPLRFRYRLLGSRVGSVHGKNLSGQWLHEFYVAETRGAELLRDYARVVETGKPAWRRGEPRVVPEPDCRTLEVLRLPLASDARSVDMILAISIYFDAGGRVLDNLAHRAPGY
jgi:hypothetical protein